jgi:Cu/Zn superoxide dismutase
VNTFESLQSLHGIPNVDRRTHEGDLGNLQPDATGAVTLNLDSRISTRLILGRGLIVHALRDQGASAQPVGSSGARLGQCVLGRTDFSSLL